MLQKRILLIVGGGIAAYKACELVRLIRKAGADVTCVLTEGGAHFVTAMTLAALSENPVHTTLWDLKNEVEMGHIQLSRQADLVVVCPATADLMARMAAGIADDLATTLLLATDKPVLAVPAMNVRMWQHAATVRNVATLRASGVTVLEPDVGAMACGEFGPGRLPEPEAVLAAIQAQLAPSPPASLPLPWPAAMCWSPPAPRASRSIRCATSPTGRAGARALPLPAQRPQPGLGSRWWPARSRCPLHPALPAWTWRPRAKWPPPCRPPCPPTWR
jgi:phosphopantothenoylcysteine decarboxylase/phosphopantothenate--cysteine ligase